MSAGKGHRNQSSVYLQNWLVLSDEQMSKHSVWGRFAPARGRYCGYYLPYTFRGWLRNIWVKLRATQKFPPPGDMVTRMVNHYEPSAVPQQISDPSCPEYEPRKSPEGQPGAQPGGFEDETLKAGFNLPSAYLTTLGPGRCVFFFFLGGGL